MPIGNDFEASEEHSLIAAVAWIAQSGVADTHEAPMICYVGGVKTTGAVPLTVALRVEAGTPIVRGCGMAMKIDNDVVGIHDPKRRHWAPKQQRS